MLVGWITDGISARVAIGLGAASLILSAAVVTLVHRQPLGRAEPPAEPIVTPPITESPALAGELPDFVA